MAVKISNRAKLIKPSPTLEVATKAKKMIASGIDVINFGVGEPDFNTPENIKISAKKAIDDNFTHYTPTPGIIELRECICEKLLKENNVCYSPENILVSPGAKASIVNILMAVCDSKDEVIIPVPYWVSYPTQVELADAKPILLHTSEKSNFKMTASQLEETILSLSTPKVLILNSPNNPTGSVYSKHELEEIAEVCLKYNILIIADEIYEKLIYDNEKHFSIASISEKIKDIVVIINGVSKAYAMTGWRLGYAAGPKDIIKYASMIQGHTTSCVNSITQKAAIIALSDDDGSVEKMRVEFEDRRNYLIKELNSISNISCNMPKGAFYAMPNISYYLEHNTKNINTSVELCKYLLENYKVALVPGEAFGINTNVRFSYSNSLNNIKEGVSRFQKGLYSLISD